MDQDAGTPFKDYVNSTIQQVKAALPPGFRLEKNIEFDLAVVNMGEVKGGIDLRVVRVGGTVGAQQIQRVKFSVAEGEDHIAEAQKKMLKQMGLR
jgi:hypothetical protein